MVVDKLVDELVWHYPVIVLGGRGERSADMALQLAPVVACILELAPTYQGPASSPFQGTERRFDDAFIKKHARLCTELLDRDPSDPLHQQASTRVHAAMRSIIVAGGARSHHPDDDSLIWEWRLDWDTHNPQRVLQYLEHCRQEGDLVGLGDALLVTNDMWCFGSDVQKAAFLDILISSLGAESIRLRHIAIRVARDNRVTLSAMENTQHPNVGEKTLVKFSQALMTSISLDIASGIGSSDRVDTTQDPADDKPNDDKPDDDLDFRFHYRRDRCYLDLILTLANSSECIPSIVKDGHLDRCLMLLKRDASNYRHLAVIFLRIEGNEGVVDSAHLKAITDEQWRKVTYWAWSYLRHRDTLKVCINIIPALAERTIKYLSDPMDLPWLSDCVEKVLDELKKEGVSEEIRSAVGTLLEAIDERQR